MYDSLFSVIQLVYCDWKYAIFVIFLGGGGA